MPFQPHRHEILLHCTAEALALAEDPAAVLWGLRYYQLLETLADTFKGQSCVYAQLHLRYQAELWTCWLLRASPSCPRSSGLIKNALTLP